MVEVLERQALGPFLLTRELGPSAYADRYLALHAVDQSSHVAMRFPLCEDRDSMRRFVDAIRMCEGLRQEHLLRVEYHTFDAEGHPWVIAPFTGDVDGVRTLAKLLREKKGQMHPFEAERAIQQVLEAAVYAHSTEPARDGREARLPVVHGPLSMDEILVDRHGRIVIELYGVGRLLRADQGWSTVRSPELVRDELRSIAEIGYQLITGLRAEAPMIPPSRIVKRLDARWDRWLARGLDAARGFETAAEALMLLPSRMPVMDDSEPEPVGVRAVFGRFRPGRW